MNCTAGRPAGQTVGKPGRASHHFSCAQPPCLRKGDSPSAFCHVVPSPAPPKEKGAVGVFEAIPPYYEFGVQ